MVFFWAVARNFGILPTARGVSTEAARDELSLSGVGVAAVEGEQDHQTLSVSAGMVSMEDVEVGSSNGVSALGTSLSGLGIFLEDGGSSTSGVLVRGVGSSTLGVIWSRGRPEAVGGGFVETGPLVEGSVVAAVLPTGSDNAAPEPFDRLRVMVVRCRFAW